ncbi:MAG: ABC-2 transporter permease, partial [Propionibacteriaceae bacterium]|nr:ABC-2 transporter permease [Propionibacteriaceae bacterium]
VLEVAMGFVAKVAVFGMVLLVVFCVFFGGFVFSIQERNHADKLYGILPLKKSEMIVGRYLYATIIGVGATILSAIVGAVVGKLSGTEMTSVEYWGVLAVAFLYFCFAIGVAFPIYLKFTFSRSYIFTMVPLYLIILLVGFIVRRQSRNGANAFTMLNDIENFFTDHFYLIFVIGIGGGLVLLIVSGVIANLIYTSQEITDPSGLRQPRYLGIR